MGTERPSWLRCSAVSIALFVLLGIGHVLPALHFALVAHRVCAEHGELLHEAPLQAAAGQGVAGHGALRSSQPSAPAPAEVSLVASGGTGAHDHEHCGVLALPGSLGAPEALTSAACLLPAGWAASLPGHERAAHVYIALLAYAPKLAPPA